jgi:hypothetical protein
LLTAIKREASDGWLYNGLPGCISYPAKKTDMPAGRSGVYLFSRYSTLT